MTEEINIKPLPEEKPSEYVNRLGENYSIFVDTHYKKKHGQFFTPLSVSRFMANYCSVRSKNITILDPGFGTGVLSFSLIEKLAKYEDINEIHLDIYEIDEKLSKLATSSCEYLKEYLNAKNINFEYNVFNKDFVIEHFDMLEGKKYSLFQNNIKEYDIVISNPPYFKISHVDPRSIATKRINYGQTNIYALFLLISANLLKKDGELIFIIPRSFASGNYFKTFRDKFFSLVQFTDFHLFGSRKHAFSKDNVLQENVIIKGVRKNVNGYNYNIKISFSNEIKDLQDSVVKELKKNDIISFENSQKFIHLPTNDKEERVLKVFRDWSTTLTDLKIKVSTGPVVAFRSKNCIIEKDSEYLSFSVPLFWLHNCKEMDIVWPLFKINKGQYIKLDAESLSILIPNKNYIFLRRFSSKDDKKRLVAAPFFAGKFSEVKYIGVENHLNYFHRPGSNLEPEEVVGLSALLNSEIYDIYFRTFNGNTNVSSTELREIAFPPLDKIWEIGDYFLRNNYNNADKVINDILNLDII